MLTQTDVSQKITDLAPWFHNLHLPDGQQTAPDHALGDFPAYKWRRLAQHLPEDLSGWRALDIGCNAGFYTFELAKRGAYVTGVDVDAHYLAQAHWAAQAYGVSGRVEFRQMQVYDLMHDDTQYDLVLFMGVFYHLRYPMLGLDIVAQKVKRMLVFQTLTVPGDEIYTETDGLKVYDRDALREVGFPKMAFIEHAFESDPTNWWIPNKAGVEAMLRSAGMRVNRDIGHEMYLCEPDTSHPSCMTTWNRAEFLAAVGQRERHD